MFSKINMFLAMAALIIAVDAFPATPFEDADAIIPEVNFDEPRMRSTTKTDIKTASLVQDSTSDHAGGSSSGPPSGSASAAASAPAPAPAPAPWLIRPTMAPTSTTKTDVKTASLVQDPNMPPCDEIKAAVRDEVHMSGMDDFLRNDEDIRGLVSYLQTRKKSDVLQNVDDESLQTFIKDLSEYQSDIFKMITDPTKGVMKSCFEPQDDKDRDSQEPSIPQQVKEKKGYMNNPEKHINDNKDDKDIDSQHDMSARLDHVEGVVEKMKESLAEAGSDHAGSDDNSIN